MPAACLEAWRTLSKRKAFASLVIYELITEFCWNPLRPFVAMRRSLEGPSTGASNAVRTIFPSLADLPGGRSAVRATGSLWHPMNPNVRKLFDLGRLHDYKRAAPLILINGLAEQSESWFANRAIWSRHFDVKVPELLVYDGDSLHKRIDAGGEITVDYLADRLADLPRRVRPAPALQPRRLEPGRPGHPDLRRRASRESVHEARPDLPLGLLRRREPADDGGGAPQPVRHPGQVGLPPTPLRQRRAGRGDHAEVPGSPMEEGGAPDAPGNGRALGRAALAAWSAQPTLIIWGANDRVISDVPGSIRAANQILRVRQVVIPRCGHAPQIEKSRLVNELVLASSATSSRTSPRRSTPCGSWQGRRGAGSRPEQRRPHDGRNTPSLDR